MTLPCIEEKSDIEVQENEASYTITVAQVDTVTVSQVVMFVRSLPSPVNKCLQDVCVSRTALPPLNLNMPSPVVKASTPSAMPPPAPSQSAESVNSHKNGEAKEKGMQINGNVGSGTFEDMKSGGTAIQFNGLQLQDELLLKIVEMQMQRD